MADLRRIVLRYVPIVVLCAVVAGLAAYLVASARTTYTARAVVAALGTRPTEQLLAGGDLEYEGDPADVIQTFVPVMRGDVVRRRAALLAGLDLGDYQVAADGSSLTLAVTATDADRSRAAATANAVVEAFRSLRREQRVRDLDDAVGALDGQVTRLQAEAASLRRRQAVATNDTTRSSLSTQRQAADQRYGAAFAARQELISRRRVASSGLTTVATATPARAVPSATRRIGLLGALLGGLLALVGCFLRERFAGFVRTADDVEQDAGLTVLSDVPRVRRSARRRLVVAQSSSAALEAFRRIRVNLRLLDHGDEGRVRSVVVTSADRAEGKTFVAANLAAVAATSGQRVVVLSTDLRKPAIERMIPARGTSPGLAGLLADARGGRVSTEAAEAALLATEVPGLDLLPAGPGPPAAVDLLGGAPFADLLQRLHEAYDLVVMDSPPLLSVSDGLVLARLADATLLVASVDRSRRKRLRLVRETLESAAPARLHAVVNRDRSGRTARRYAPSSPAAPSTASSATPSAASSG